MTGRHNGNRRIYVIIVAAGSGIRFGASLPKQYMPLAGKPVLAYSVERFHSVFPDAQIAIALHPDYEGMWREMAAEHNLPATVIVHGGASRAESTYNALRKLSPDDNDIVMIHDGARPLVSGSLIRRLYDAAVSGSCAGYIPAVAETDTLRRTFESGLSQVVDRSDYRRVQTPQVFRAGILLTANEAAKEKGFENFTDDASVVESMYPDSVEMAEGDPCNIKITNPLDIRIAEAILSYTTC